MKGRELRKWRQDQFLSQSDLAGLLGVHYTSVANWEASRSNPPAMLDLAIEAITGQRERLVRRLRALQEKLAHQRRLKEIAQGIPERRATAQALAEATRAATSNGRPQYTVRRKPDGWVVLATKTNKIIGEYGVGRVGASLAAEAAEALNREALA